jgi:tRNA threonylcarbamoyl adenosine modification protein YeaZ
VLALLIETSGRSGWVALIDDSQILGSIRLEQGRRHARDLAPAAGSLLENQGLRANQVDCVAVSQGPGSYTGLRVGIASALAFRFATDCHLVLVPTFEILAQSDLAPANVNEPHNGVGATTGDIPRAEVVADALKGWVYHQGFARKDDGLWQPVRPLAVETIPQWEAVREKRAAVLYAADSSELAARGIPGTLVEPQLPAFAALVRARAGRGEWNDSDIAEPLYLRPSSAELQMLQKSQETRV